ncbi:PKD domain-containing protein [Myroides fluvii]|uniref:PKD domain-containing protein n=1 Tax=Myroides fluvii TaxID=2572594 RepID=UPI00131D3E97|nr:PKD domain-containing protein [Myroides fluvii]
MKRRVKLLVLVSTVLCSGISCSSDRESGEEETKTAKKTVTKVLEYAPAFGQFVNELPLYEAGDTQESMRVKAEKALVKNEVITLGGFGGYVVFGFDHTIDNVPDKRDVRILGNAFANNAEPGVILVAYDKNKNGMPDEDEWFEIAGSEHHNLAVIENYRIVYYRPTKQAEETPGEVKEYMRWKDNQGNEGWKTKNQFHQQSYYPQWIKADSIAYSGTLLPNNAVEVGSSENSWQLKAFAWGYADNYPNTREGATIDIDWAVDKAGNKVHLPGIDFIKIYTGLNQEAGWLGETSTEVAGAIDLHLE